MSAQRKLGSCEAMQAFLDCLGSHSWKLVFVSEMDAFDHSWSKESDILECCSPHVLIRRCLGEGSSSYAWPVHRDFAALLRQVRFQGRASSVEFSGAGLSSLVCIGVQGYHGYNSHLETIS